MRIQLILSSSIYLNIKKSMNSFSGGYNYITDLLVAAVCLGCVLTLM